MSKSYSAATKDGQQGDLVFLEGTDKASITFGTESILIDTTLLYADGGNSFKLDQTLAELRQSSQETKLIIPLAKDIVTVTKKPSQRVIRLHKGVRERTETVQVSLEHQDVDVKRVEIGEVVDVPPTLREENGVTVIPILREELILTKQLILEAEIHVSKVSRQELHEETVTLREETIAVERGEEKESM